MGASVVKTEETLSSDPGARAPPGGVPDFGERYSIEKEIGRGGMGRVFVARDRKLAREVAIKVLAPGAHSEEELRRFEQEARAAGSLNHPNIVDVHDIGTHEGSPYIVSELLQGSTLRERLAQKPIPLANALDYAVQLAQGLAAAHEHGVIHRDLKPENIFITDQGRLKILDFGIAKFTRPPADTLEQRGRPQTIETGTIMGTVGYMAPEQVRGEHVDHRSDIFAAGVILYEMLAGRSAFERDTAVETGYAILNDDPPPLPGGVPATLRRLVERCLAKRPEDRFQSAHELADILASAAAVEPVPARRRGIYWWALGVGALLILVALAVLGWKLRARGEGPGNSIAVLPFVNMSNDRENEYFSDGITEELINALANVEGLRVTSRTSAFAFKGKEVGVRKIGEELNVATVLEGSVRREGTSVRVTAQLVSAADGYHVWSKTYDRELKNIFALEDELARSIARALAPRLGAREPAPLVRPATASTAAHDDYLRGRYFWSQRTSESLGKAISFFQKAIAEDPSYALAHTGLGESYALLIEHGDAPAAEQLPKAKEAVRKALELDGTLAEAHAALGLISGYDYDWKTAERELQRAIELNPRYATAHHWFGIVLGFTGRPAEARTEIERARQLDPTSVIINTTSSVWHLMAREYPQAIEDANKALELDPHFAGARMNLAFAYTQTGRYAEALREFDTLEHNDFWFAARGYTLAVSGQRDAARRVLAELMDRAGRERVSPYRVAIIHAGLGDKDAAFAWLDKAYAEHDVRLSFLKVSPLWDSLRSDPRFAQLLQRLHLE